MKPLGGNGSSDVLSSSLVGRCEVLAWCERVGPAATKRRRTSPGSGSLDSLLKEFCCEDPAERRSTLPNTHRHTHTQTRMSGASADGVFL